MKTKTIKTLPIKRTRRSRLGPATGSAARPRIFSGDASGKMWEEINGAKTIAELRMALYVVCCRIQELESRVENQTQHNEKI